jgi:hypothetical protein
MPTDIVGSKRPAGAKPFVADLDYQVKYQRAYRLCDNFRKDTPDLLNLVKT